MPSLPLAIPDILGHRHARASRRALMTTPRRRPELPLHLRAERWMVNARRVKLAIVGFVGAAIAVYCPPTPFASARAKHGQFGTHYPTEFCDSSMKCHFTGRPWRAKQPTTMEEDVEKAAWSLDKLQFKLDASKNIPPRTPPD